MKCNFSLVNEGETVGNTLMQYLCSHEMISTDKSGKFVVLDTAATEKLINILLLHSANKSKDDGLCITSGILGIYWDNNSAFGYIDTKPFIPVYRNGFENKNIVENTINEFLLNNPDKKIDPAVIRMLKAFVVDTLQQREFPENLTFKEKCKVIREAFKK